MVSIVISAVIFQLAAAFLSFRLIRLTGRRLAWSLVSAALLLMALRRAITLIIFFKGDFHGSLQDYNEITGLVISVLMFIGIAGIAPVFRSIKTSEERYRNSQQLLSDILNSIPQAVFWKDGNGAYLGCNRLFATLAGFNDQQKLLGLHDSEINWPSDSEAIHTATTALTDDQRGTSLHVVKSGNKTDGQYWIDTSLVPLKTTDGRRAGIIGIFEDITERIIAEEDHKRFEAHFHQVQKMESIGTLAGGIAHDFNNILTSIIGFSELAQIKQAENEPVEHELNQVLKASLRARDLVKQILTFSRQAVIHREALTFRPLIEEIMRFIRASLPKSIEIKIDLDLENENLIMADATQIHQILMNICTNASHAMSTGGMLSLKITRVDLVDEATLQYKDLKPGPYYRLSITDNGSGIEPEIASKIFDPFFTTKKPGEGTGMGLSVVHGIVKDMDGAISVYSEPGKGTTFNILLPQYKGIPGEARVARDTLVAGSGRILFVDDEEDIVAACRGLLERLGYSVSATINPVEALQIFDAQPQSFDCVLTDMTMPKMTGLELSEQLIRIRPDIPIILCTGFSLGLTESEIQNAGIRDLLIKPVIASELSSTIHDVLSKGDSLPIQ